MTTNAPTRAFRSAHAIGHLVDRIRSGSVSAGIACGVDLPLSPSMLDAWVSMRVYSAPGKGSEDVWRRAIPFDQDRSGLTLGEACVSLVLEDMDHAVRRGCEPLAELVGWGAATDAADMLRPSGDRQVECMRSALRDAGVRPEQVHYVNAHGTGTRVGDAVEADSIHRVFPHAPWVSSTKASHGHTLGAGGCLEAAVSIGALRRRKAPPTYGLERPDESMPTAGFVAGHTSKALDPEGCALSNSFAFGGHNVSLLFGLPR